MSDPMNIHKNSKPTLELENKLESFYDAITPDPAFVHELGLQIAQRSQQVSASRPGFLAWLKNSLRRRPAFAASMAVLAMLILAITLAGPRQVLASVERLLGFVPGSGFVQPGETRVLADPVEAKQGEVTLRIEKVIADSRQTEISLTASGLPREKFGPQSGEQDPQLRAYLLLPDGQQYRSNMSMSGIGDTLQASYIFDPLPKDVVQFTLVLPRLPGVPAAFAPENWSVPIRLVTAQISPTGSPSELPVAPGYTPANNLVSAQGVNVEVAQVGQAAQETGLQIQYHWDNPEWQQLNDAELTLSDQNGHIYSQLHEPMELSGAPESLRTYRFQPFELGASQAVLTVNRLQFTFKSPAHFTFDPREGIQVGQPLDISSQPGSKMEIAGVPVQLLSVTINPGADEGSKLQPAHYHLEVLLQDTPLDGLALENTTMSLNPELMVSSSTEILPGNQMKITIDLPEIPGRPLALYFSRGEVSLKGSWVIHWDLPGK
ncbi:MAG: hypothetical protein M1281_16860 [Chloroflexi bacterium]|nr:hypothetical protein [Chloroflexota bacterium]